MGVTQLETSSPDMLLGVDKTRPRVQQAVMATMQNTGGTLFPKQICTHNVLQLKKEAKKYNPICHGLLEGI